MAKAGRGQTRRDSKRRVLRPGESVRADGKYQYKYHIDDIVDCSDFERESYWHYTVCPKCNTKNNIEV